MTIDYTAIGQYSTDIFTQEAVRIINYHDSAQVNIKKNRKRSKPEFRGQAFDLKIYLH
jgi:hypothetical protein